MSAAPVVLSPSVSHAGLHIAARLVVAAAQPAATPDVNTRKGPHRLRLVQAVAAAAAAPAPPRRMPVASERGNFAFYRKYTEGMLRRCMRLSLETARVPSFMGRELFRGNVTQYRVTGFDDVVIYVADIENCIARLGKDRQVLIRRIGLQQFTHAETAAMLQVPLRSLVRHYNEALDDLTRMFLERRMMQPQWVGAGEA